MWNRKGIAAIFMAEEIIEIVESGPGDRRHTHGAGLMGRQENQVLSIRPFALFVEAFQRMHFPVPERVFQLVVGLCQHQRKV